MSVLTIKPSRDAAALNLILNDPEILPNIRDDSIKGEANAAPLMNRFNHLLLIMDEEKPVGFALFMAVGPNIYEMHSGILKDYRGARAVEAAKEIFDWMFIRTDCETITTWAWSTAKHVLFMAHAVGFTEDSHMPWPNTVAGEKVERFAFSLHFLEWSRVGRLRNQRDGWLLGVALESYQMGLFSLFVKIGCAGFAEKAAMLYQRWAPIVRLPTVNILGSRGGNFTIEVEGQVVQIDSELNPTVIEQKPTPPPPMSPIIRP